MRVSSPIKIALGFSVVLFLLVINAFVSFASISRITEANRQVTVRHEAELQLQGVLTSMIDAETGTRGFLLSGQEQFLDPYYQGTGAVDEHLRRLDELVTEPPIRKKVGDLRRNVQERKEGLERAIQTRRNEGFESALDLFQTGVGKRLMDQLRGTVADIQQAESDELVRQRAQARTAINSSVATLVASSVLGLALLGVIWYVLRRDAASREESAKALRASIDRFGAIVNSTSHIVWTRTTQGEFGEPQPSWTAFTGQSYEQIQGLGWLAVLHPDDRDKVRNEWAKALANPGPFSFEYRLRRKDGQYRHMLVQGTPVREKDGTIREWVGTSVDMTEKIESEAQLNREQARNTAILETAMDAIIAMDSSSTITEWNPAAEAAFGYTRAEAIGKSLPELIIPERLREAHRKGMAHFLATGEGPVINNRIEVPGLRRDGSEFPVELSIVEIEGQGEPIFSATLRDISERKAAELAMEAHAKLATLSGQIGLALTKSQPKEEMLQECAELLKDCIPAKLVRIFVLGEYEDVLNLRASAGTPDAPSEAADELPLTGCAIGRSLVEHHIAIREGEPTELCDQDTSWFEREDIHAVAYYPLLIEGRLLGSVAIYSSHPMARDTRQALTTIADAIAVGIRRKRTELDLIQAKSIAEEASRTKSLFLANMSHELRTPLNAILGYSEMLQEEAEEEGLPAFTSDLERINGAGKHLLSLINDILDLSKIEAGKMELYIEEFPVEQVANEVASTIKTIAEKNGNRLEVEVDPAAGSMRGDLTKVRQCLLNLLSNAAKFTKDGAITLSIGREEMETVANETPRDWMVFRVQDTGIGMSAEQIVNLFQAFSQADASTTRKFGGTGLGLALTRRFSQMMGGDVTVHSEPNVGSIFTIKIPAESDQTVESNSADRAPLQTSRVEEPVSTPSITEPGTCVLVIDDDPTQRDLLRRFLQKEGFPCEVASNGEEGLRLARQLRPIAITLDVMMPGMDGWTVLSHLKADDHLNDIPVIMLTMVDDKNRGLAMGASDYATKPIDRHKLSSILKKYACPNPPCTILLVEDEEVTRDMMRTMLTKDGWDVVEATNGAEALEAVSKKRPALILLDLMMPKMDGFEFAAELNRVPEWRSIPTVVLTAKDITDEDRLRLNGYVEKIVQKAGRSGEDLMTQVKDLVVACSLQRPAPEHNDPATDPNPPAP